MNFEKKIEKDTSPESREGISSQIDLRFFRHDQKEKGEEKSDNDILLTLEGRLHAKEKARDTNIEQSIVFGSPRKRTQQTAGYVMAGGLEDITGEESFEELKEKIDQGLRVGTKIGIDPRLDFILDEESAYGKKAMEAFLGGRYLKFLVEDSDQLAKESGDFESSTYTRHIQAVASIIKKYIDIAPRWDKIVREKSDSYAPELKRFFGTHQGVQEAFLAKVIELTRGTQERDRFVAALKNQGFGFAEGFEANVLMEKNGEMKIHISYKKESENPEESFVFEEDVPPELIEQISEEN